MPLKPTLLKTDFRHQVLVLSFVPFVLWGGAAVLLVKWSEHLGAVLAAVFLVFLGNVIGKASLALQYRLASCALPKMLPGAPGINFLLFDAEPPATFHKLKIIPEDAGFLYAEDGRYRITTLLHDFAVPFEALQLEPIRHGKGPAGLLLRFQPAGSSETIEFAAAFKYIGSNMQIAINKGLKCAWAAKVIDSMRS